MDIIPFQFYPKEKKNSIPDHTNPRRSSLFHLPLIHTNVRLNCCLKFFSAQISPKKAVHVIHPFKYITVKYQFCFRINDILENYYCFKINDVFIFLYYVLYNIDMSIFLAKFLRINKYF